MEVSAMEDDSLFFSDARPEEFGELVLSRFANSTQGEHQHLCAVVGAMSQELRDKSLPLTPVAYFGAASSSLDRLLSSEPNPPAQAVESLATLLSFVLPRLPAAIVKKKLDFVSGLVVRVLQSSSVSACGAVSGLKCMGHLIMVRDRANWSEISQPYGVVFSFISDSRPKVRRQAHLCIRDVLQRFQGTPSLGHASKTIINAFEKLLLLVGGSKSDSNEGSRRAQEVLHALDAFKEFLPLISVEYMAKILNYFRTLLGLSQPLVTRRVTDCLNAICLHPATEVPAEALLDLLCALAVSVSGSETSADGMTFIARLLSVGMIKISNVNRKICGVKLPLIFNALKDILASEHEEAVYAAVDAFKSLIDACVDETLVLEGVNRIRESSMERRTSGPTTVEKLCATLESVLDYQYSGVWDRSFQVVSAMFDKLGEYSSYLMRGTLQNLADMQKLADEGFPCRKQLNKCIGSALAAMGPETFLSLLPLRLEAPDLSDVNVWLLPILKQYTIGAHLSFFTESIMVSTEMMKNKAQKFEAAGHIVSSRSAESLVYSLWSLLPSFCNYPRDTAEGFKDLEKLLQRALQELPDLRGIICASLQILIQQNKGIVHNKEVFSADDADLPTRRALSFYTPKVAEDNLKALGSCAGNLLKTMSEIFFNSTRDDGGCLQSTIGELASISDKRVVKILFKNKMRRLLAVTRQVGSDSSNIGNASEENSLTLARARLLDLAVSLLPGLDAEEVDLLFTVIKPELQGGEVLIQKKAYKVLLVILRDSDGFISSKLGELLKLMTEVMPACHSSSKRHRLDCLYLLISHVLKAVGSDQMRRDIICAFLTEIILALKEPNKKTRNRAYDVLVQIGHAYGDEENGGNRENLDQLFNMVANCVVGDTHMISAAVKGLARLAYEFSDLVSTAYKLLPSTFLLLQRKNREIIKANLGLLKVLVAKSPVEGLQAHLKSMVEGLLKWQDDSKNHFKAKVKHLLEMLVRKCGVDAVKSVMPDEHMKLLKNIRKINERKEEKSGATSSENRSQISKATTSRLSKWNHTKIFSDFDEDDEDSDADYMDASILSRPRNKPSSLKSKASKKNRRLGKSLPEDDMDQSDDEPLDLLDRSKTRSALRSSGQPKRRSESDDEPEFDPEGRLIIREGGRPKRRRPSDPGSDSKSETRSQFSVSSSKRGQKRVKTSQSGYAYTGSEYASKKAGGDVKRKHKLEPYAYWPLDRKLMSRRREHRSTARRGMSSVVKMTKQLEGKSVARALSMKFTRMKKVSKKGSES